jgi:ethanolamine ammonia-lyase small subunit
MTDDARRPAAGATADPWGFLRGFTDARIALGRAGGSVPTHALLDFQLAHAQARDAVQRDLDTDALCNRIESMGWGALRLRSAAPDRRAFVQRPDLGRVLDEPSRSALETRRTVGARCDAVFVLADGLSAIALERHAVPLLEQVLPRLTERAWRIAPLCVVQQGRVAIADEIGALLEADLSVILIGERPGLSSPDSLGIYLTWDPLPGRSNAQRNCISNVRPQGLDYALAAHKLVHLMRAAKTLRRSGVELKEDAPALPGRSDMALPDPGDASAV